MGSMARATGTFMALLLAVACRRETPPPEPPMPAQPPARSTSPPPPEPARAPEPSDGIEQARRLLERDDPTAAANLLDRIVAQDPDEPQARALRAIAKARLGEADAIEDARAGLAAPTLHYAEWLELARILLAFGDADAAAQACTRAAEIQPREPEPLRMRLKARLLGADWAAIVAAADELIALGEDDPQVWIAKGDALVRLQRYAPAAEAYRQALLALPEGAQERNAVERVLREVESRIGPR
jgi:uncharacterized protein HemY